MQLDAGAAREARQFADEIERTFETQPMLLELDLAAARRGMHEQAAPLPPSLPVTVADREIRLAGRGLGARTFTPETVRDVYLHFHGGGWCIGSSRTQDARLGALAVATEAIVVSIDYRLAPEHPFPAALDDCVESVRWALAFAEREISRREILIGGESAGAHLVALALIRLRDEGTAIAGIRGANLTFGVFDLGQSPSQRLSGAARLGITSDLLERCYARLLPGRTHEERRSPEVSPLYADLRALPPALFTVGLRDLLLDDSLFMFERWRAAGNAATLAAYPEALHGFVSHPLEVARLANATIHEWLRERG